MQRSIALAVAAHAHLARASLLGYVVRIPLQCNGFGRLAVGQRHGRKRAWTLRDLDRSRLWFLYFDPVGYRWEVRPVANDEDPVVTVVQPIPGPPPTVSER